MWEYKVHYIKLTAPFGNITAVKIDKKLEQLMAQMGAQGWELTGVSPNIFGGTHQGDILYFKRPQPAHNS